MKYLVLGSSGQIGSSLVKYLRDLNCVVEEHDIKIDNYVHDLRINKEYLRYVVKNNDFVVFLAFDVGGSKYLKKYENTYDFIDNNVKIMKNVFDVLREEKKPFIFASTQMADMPFSPYGNLKLLGEKYTNILDGIVVRLWNVYGHEEEEEKSHVITDFIKMALKEQKIKVMTNGKERRQMLYADDCSECLYFLSKNYNKFKGKNIHLSSFEWVTIKKIAKIVAKKINSTYEFSEFEDDVQKNSQTNPDKFILKYWKPKFSLEEGIQCIINKMKK